jgi:hypothetical protein
VNVGRTPGRGGGFSGVRYIRCGSVRHRLQRAPVKVQQNQQLANVVKHGVLGVECSNHSVPTIFCKGNQPLTGLIPFFISGRRKTRAKLAQNYPAISLISRSGTASDQTTSA